MCVWEGGRERCCVGGREGRKEKCCVRGYMEGRGDVNGWGECMWEGGRGIV